MTQGANQNSDWKKAQNGNRASANDWKRLEAGELNAVDFLLKGQPTEFQLDLLQLGRRLNWDENDPGFAVPLALCHTEKVLALYPEQLKQVLEETSHRFEMKWERIQAALNVSAEKGVQAAGRIDGRLAEVRSLLDAEIARVEELLQAERLKMQQAMATEREALRELMAQERADMTRLTQMVTEQQKQVLIAQTNELIHEGALSAQRQAEQQVKQIVKGVRKKHFWETITVALLAAMSMLVVGWIGGLLLGRQPQLTSQLELLEQRTGIQQVETSWILEKANRAECFYGIKARSDPQCQ